MYNPTWKDLDYPFKWITFWVLETFRMSQTLCHLANNAVNNYACLFWGQLLQMVVAMQNSTGQRYRRDALSVLLHGEKGQIKFNECFFILILFSVCFFSASATAALTCWLLTCRHCHFHPSICSVIGNFFLILCWILTLTSPPAMTQFLRRDQYTFCRLWCPFVRSAIFILSHGCDRVCFCETARREMSSDNPEPSLAFGGWVAPVS